MREAVHSIRRQQRPWQRGTWLAIIGLTCLAPWAQVTAQNAGVEALEAAAEDIVDPVSETDARIRTRIANIFAQIESLTSISVDVREGVVILSGSVANEVQAARAVELANRIDGIITVEDRIERTLDVEANVAPVLDALKADSQRWLRALPLLGLATLLFLFIAYTGHRLAKWSSLWLRLTPNPFLAELLAQAVRIALIILGLVMALNLIGATALMGTILGGAGVLGLAIGFGVRDTMENYISSIMLSLRQPFRANDHVVINDHAGKVIRLTSRATVLMTLDGNHLRIPNSTVFKSVILNYTRNPERRFDFELGVDGNDDPLAAISTGVEAVRNLEFVLSEPKPNAIVKAVGDSNIVLTFTGWVNQTQTDFGKARSLAISAAKTALEEQGFSLPEPIYRLRIDAAGARLVEGIVPGAAAATMATADSQPAPKALSAADTAEVLDVRPDEHLEDKVNEERARGSDQDLLDSDRPVE